MMHGQYTPPMQQDDYLFPPYDPSLNRERSHTPPMFTYSTYPPPPAPEDPLVHPYDAVPAYAHHAYSHRPADSAYPEYLSPPPVPVTLPPMTHFNDAIKREPGYPEDSIPSYMTYSSYSIPGVDISGAAAHPSPYDHMPHVSCCAHPEQRKGVRVADRKPPQTPPLSHSYDHSAACSDSGSYDAYPTTPLSMPGSPGLVQQH